MLRGFNPVLYVPQPSITFNLPHSPPSCCIRASSTSAPIVWLDQPSQLRNEDAGAATLPTAQAEPSHRMSLSCSMCKPFSQPLPTTKQLSLCRRKQITLGHRMGGGKRTQVRPKWAKSWYTSCTAPASIRSCKSITVCMCRARISITVWSYIQGCTEQMQMGTETSREQPNPNPGVYSKTNKHHVAKYLCLLFVLGWFDTWNYS